MTQPVQVLLVEDSEDDAILLAHRLAPHAEPVAITRVDTAFALQAALEAQAWDFVISDYHMPLLSGLVALELVRRHSSDLPFILVSATMGEDVAVDAMRAGANDYVMKHKMGRLLPAFQRELRAARARHDNAAQRASQMLRIDRISHYDPATGLANAVSFDRNLALLTNEAGARGHKLAVVVVDLPRYSAVVQVVGRAGGEELAAQAAARLRALLEDAGALARLAPDRFAMTLSLPGADASALESLLQGLPACFQAPFAVRGLECRVQPAAGVAIYPDDAPSAERVLRNAQAAAQRAAAGALPWLPYSGEMTAEVADKLAMETAMRLALERREFTLHYQPKLALRDGRIASVEALIRWNSPDLGLVYPAQFIPVLEETGLIVEVGEWALRQAIADHARWKVAGVRAPRVAVNVSVTQLHHPGFVALVQAAVAGCAGRPPLDLEITESLLMQDVGESIAKLAAIRALGVGISIDDFGTGYSSLAYLARLPVAAVKIDRVFVASMLEDAGTMRLVATMIELAHSLRLSVVAEGVESREQADALHELRCDEIQGYLVGRPLPWEGLVARLAAEPPIAGAVKVAALS